MSITIGGGKQTANLANTATLKSAEQEQAPSHVNPFTPRRGNTEAERIVVLHFSAMEANLHSQL